MNNDVYIAWDIMSFVMLCIKANGNLMRLRRKLAKPSFTDEIL